MAATARKVLSPLAPRPIAKKIVVGYDDDDADGDGDDDDDDDDVAGCRVVDDDGSNEELGCGDDGRDDGEGSCWELEVFSVNITFTLIIQCYQHLYF